MPALLLRGVLWCLLAGGGAVMGVMGAAFGTDPGRAVVIEFGLAVVNRSLRGSLTVGGSEGRPLRGLTLHNVTLADTAGRPVITARHVRVRYRVRDLLGGRIVLGQLSVDHPAMRLARTSDGRWNVQEVLKLGERPRERPKPFVAFGDVVVDSGVVTITGETIRTITLHAARLPYVRLSSPLPGQGATRLELNELRLDMANPAVRIEDADGAIEVVGDSVVLNLDAVRLAGTTSSVSGWLHDGLFDLRLDAGRLDVADLSAFTASLPSGVRGAQGRARTHIARGRPGALTVVADGLSLTPGDGGRLTGRVTASLASGGAWALADTDLRTEGVSLDLLRAIVDSVPLVGRLSGRTRAEGSADSLAVRVEWQFVDEAIPSRPATTIVAEGAVRFGGDAGVTFHDLGVTRSTVALATVERLVPAVAVRGTLDATGTLSGPWRDVTFSGTMRHRDGALPATMARGLVRLNTGGEEVVVEADLALDSVSMDGLRPSYPALPLLGSFAGDVRVAGPGTALAISADLAGPVGAFRGTARVLTDGVARRVEALDLTFTDATVRAIEDRLLDTRLTGSARGTVAVDSALRALDMTVRLERFTVAAVPMDSAIAVFRTGQDRLHVDSLSVWAAPFSAFGRGALGRAAAVHDSVRIVAAIETLDALRPLLTRLAGPGHESWLPDTLLGAVELTVVAAGSLGSLNLGARATVAGMQWGPYRVSRGDATVRRLRDGTLGVSARVDSLAIGAMGFSALHLTTAGNETRQAFQLRTRVGDHAAALVGGVLDRDSAHTAVRLDSLAMLAGDVVWFLERPGSVTVSDSAVEFDSLAFAPPSGASRITVAGVLPRLGHGVLAVRVEALRLDELWAMLQRDPDLASGELSGLLALSGTARAPLLEAALALRDGVFGEFRAPYVETNALYRDRRLTGTVRLFRVGEQILGVEVALPVDLALMGVERRRLPGPLTIRATATDVDLALLDALSPAVRRMAGRFSADFGVAGSWERPELTGSISVDGGAASFPALGVRHERMNGRVVLAGDSLRIERLSIASGNGTAQVTGSIRLVELTDARLALTIRATDFRAIDVPELVAATVSGDVQLRGPVSRATLTGRGTVTRGVVWFADIVEKDIINLEDTVYAGLVDPTLLREEGLGAGFENRFLDSLAIDGLQLIMGADVWLRSNEANIALTGDLTLAKRGRNYRLDGSLSTPRGTYRLQLIPWLEGFEREFTVTRGQVQYFGTADLDAALDVEARHVVRSRRGDNVTVFVRVGGTIYNPTLTLLSDHRPALSDTEIISYLLVGAPSVAAGGAGLPQQQALGMAEAIAGRLSGQIGGLITDLGVPIDYFEFRPQFDGGGVSGTLSVGRRLSDRVFVTVSPRLCGRDPWDLYNLGFGLEYRLSRAWRFAVAADPLGSCSLLGADPSTLRYQLGVDLWWETTY